MDPPLSELNASESLLTVGTSVVEVLPDLGISGRKRKAFVLTNTSTGGQTITISMGNEPTAGAGAVLYPGGSYTEFRDPSFIVFQRRITAIASGAGAKLSIQERVEA